MTVCKWLPDFNACYVIMPVAQNNPACHSSRAGNNSSCVLDVLPLQVLLLFLCVLINVKLMSAP